MKKVIVPISIAVVLIALLLVIRYQTDKPTAPATEQQPATAQQEETPTTADATIAAPAESSGGKIVIAVPNWPSAKARAHVLKVVVEDNFGVEVELQNSTNPVIFAGMDSGAMHVHPEVWLPNHANLHQKYVEENKTVRQGQIKVNADQAICTTSDTLANTGISKLEELAKPEVAAKFDSDGDGKGEMWIGATGWASTNVEKIRAKSYGYDQTMQLKEMDEMLAMAEIDAAITKKDNIVFYCYSPHHVFMLYDLHQLKEEPHDPDQWHVLQPTDDPDWLQKSKALTAWDKAWMYVYHAAELESSHPEVAKMLAKVKIDNAATSEMAYALSVKKTPADQFAKEWVAKNAALVDSWLQ